MLKKLCRTFAFGLVFALGAIAIPSMGAVISLFTGPAGTNPIAFPSDLPDLNTLINSINANASFAGTGAPSNVIGTVSTSSTKLGSAGTSTVALQIVNPIVFTSTVATATCTISSGLVHNPAGCLAFFDNNGTLRWLPFY